METLKKLLKCETKMLTEANSYADKYHAAKMAEDQIMADYYYSVADMHLQGYNKAKATIAMYLNRNPSKDVAEVYTTLRDLMDDFYNDVKAKM